MENIGTLFGSVACAILIYQMAKPYFYKPKDDRLDDWIKQQKKKR
jgi:hypothetical protein